MSKLMKTHLLHRLIGCFLIIWMIPACLLAQNQLHGLQQYQEMVFVHTDKPYYLTGETLWFKAYCTKLKGGQLTELSSVLYIELFNSENQPVAQVKTSLKSGIGHGQMLLSTRLATGSYVLRAYTAWMRNSSQEYFYQQRIMVINPLTELPVNINNKEASGANSYFSSGTEAISKESIPAVKVITNQEIYSNRELVMMDLVTSGNEEDQALNLSISVYPYHQQLEHDGNNILLTIEDPEGRELLVESDREKLHHFPETIGPIIYGKSENSVGPKNNNHLFVSIGGKASRVYQVIGIDSSNFAVELPPGIDYAHLYFWSTEYQNTNVILQHSFDQRLPQLSAPPLQFDSSTIKFIESQSVNMQVSNLYQEYTKIHGHQKFKTKEDIPFYGHPEFQYYLDNYTRFPSLKEVFVEYIRNVSYRKRGGTSNFYVRDDFSNSKSLANKLLFDLPALVMLDGIPVNDHTWVMNIDPLLVESIDVVTKKYFIGNGAFSGMVNINTYNHDFAGMEVPLELDKKSYQSLQRPMMFHHPDYGATLSKNSRIPDRRNTLFWDPDIEIASKEPEQFQFYTGDTNGEYLIVINGITSQGTFFHQTKFIKVIKSNTP